MIAKGSAAKRHRQSEKKRIQNRVVRSQVRSSAKKVLVAIDKKDQSAASEAYLAFSKLIDSAARKGVYHSNTAARKKSRLATRVNGITA